MSTIGLVLRASARDLARNRWLIAYAAGFWAVTEALFYFGGSGPQVILSLLNAVLFVVPLVALVFGTAHVHASREFIEMLLSQPLSRRSVFAGLYLGLALPLTAAFLLGAGVPLLLHGAAADAPRLALALLAVGGALLTLTFAALAMVIALATDDRLRGMMLALGAWFVLTLAYDGAVLVLVSAMGDWPLERPLLALMLLNPVDVARVLVLTALDASALLGYTGALFRRVFGSALGPAVAVAALSAWAAIPVLVARRRFLRRDF